MVDTARMDSGGPGASAVDVAVCTFRRESLDRTLASLAGQVLPEGAAPS